MPPSSSSSWCSYSTVKFIRIEDKRLATLHYIMQLGIFLYIVVYQIIGHLGYAVSEKPIGSVRLSVQPPMAPHGGDPNKNIDYEYNFPPLTSLPYCTQYNGTVKVPSQYPCKDYGEIEAVYPVTGTSPFFLTTRIQESNQSLVCEVPPSGKTCTQTYAFGCDHGFVPCHDKKRAAQEKYFLTGVEDFTLMLDHAAQSPTDASLSGDVSRMKGYLKKCDTDETIMPNKTPGGQDYYTISQLLSAISTPAGCGTSLDAKSSVYDSEDSARYEGTVIIITIDYSNSKPWRGILDTIEYTYSVTQLQGAKSKVMEAIWTKYPDKRIIKNRHGIVFVVLQEGDLKSFELFTMLISTTTSLALLAMATTIVDAMMNYCLKNKDIYKKMKYAEIQVTENDDGSINYESI
jgi:hypothetical protein|eukprot:g6991.t1